VIVVKFNVALWYCTKSWDGM